MISFEILRATIGLLDREIDLLLLFSTFVAFVPSPPQRAPGGTPGAPWAASRGLS